MALEIREGFLEEGLFEQEGLLTGWQVGSRECVRQRPQQVQRPCRWRGGWVGMRLWLG